MNKLIETLCKGFDKSLGNIDGKPKTTKSNKTASSTSPLQERLREKRAQSSQKPLKEMNDRQLRAEKADIASARRSGTITPEQERREYELWCIDMINSILAYYYFGSSGEELVASQERSWKNHLADDIKKLGRDRVVELAQGQIDSMNGVDTDVFTDDEGLSYNSIRWKNESLKIDEANHLTGAQRYNNRMHSMFEYRFAFNDYCADWLKNNTELSDAEITKLKNDMKTDYQVRTTLGNDEAWRKFFDEFSAWWNSKQKEAQRQKRREQYAKRQATKKGLEEGRKPTSPYSHFKNYSKGFNQRTLRGRFTPGFDTNPELQRLGKIENDAYYDEVNQIKSEVGEDSVKLAQRTKDGEARLKKAHVDYLQQHGDDVDNDEITRFNGRILANQHLSWSADNYNKAHNIPIDECIYRGAKRLKSISRKK